MLYICIGNPRDKKHYCWAAAKRSLKGTPQVTLRKDFIHLLSFRITKTIQKCAVSTYPLRFAQHLTREALIAFYKTQLLWDEGAWQKITRPLFCCHTFSLLPFLILLWPATLIRHLFMFYPPERVKSLNILTKILTKNAEITFRTQTPQCKPFSASIPIKTRLFLYTKLPKNKHYKNENWPYKHTIYQKFDRLSAMVIILKASGWLIWSLV